MKREELINMELQGLGLIDIALNHWLKKYGFSARVRGADTDFFWYHNDTIGYSFFFPIEAKTNWDSLLEELKCQYTIDIFYSAFLHEVGHSETYYTFTEEEIEECEKTHQLTIEVPSSFAEDTHYVYSHLPTEYVATSWAVNSINTYPERVKELVDLVGKAIRLFYKLNDVVDEDSFDF